MVPLALDSMHLMFDDDEDNDNDSNDDDDDNDGGTISIGIGTGYWHWRLGRCLAKGTDLPLCCVLGFSSCWDVSV